MPQTSSTLPVALTTALPAAEAIYMAFFALVAEAGLAGATLHRLALTNHWPMAQLRQDYPTLGHLLARFSDFVTREMHDSVVPDADALPRDLYFELLMARLDVLQNYRDGFVRLLAELPSRPDLAAVMLRQSNIFLSDIMDVAGWSGSLWRRPLDQAGLALFYARLLRVWQKDGTSDLSKTMAWLDEALDKQPKWLGFAADTDHTEAAVTKEE